MQAGGFNLNAIKRLLSESSIDRYLGLKRAITTPFESESPEILTLAELTDRFGEVAPKVLLKAQRLELLINMGDGTFQAPSPALLRAAEEVMQHGIPLSAALSVVREVRHSCESVSRAFVKLFIEELWKPFEEAGQPEEDWPRVMDAVERLRPLASDAVVSVFQQTMTSEVERAFGKELGRVARKGG